MTTSASPLRSTRRSAAPRSQWRSLNASSFTVPFSPLRAPSARSSTSGSSSPGTSSASRAQLGQDRVLDGVQRDRADLVLDAADRRRIPVQRQRVVDRAPAGRAAARSRRRRSPRPTCAPPETSRCPMPTSLTAARALTLHAPGQYSPGTSPTRASTPSAASAAAIRLRRVLEALVRGARRRLARASRARRRACPRETRRPAPRPGAGRARSRPLGPPSRPPRNPG